MLSNNNILLYIREIKVPKICKIYDDEIELLFNNLKEATKIEEIRAVFVKFIETFTMIPELWILWLRLECTNKADYDVKGDESYYEKKIRLMGEKHFNLDHFVIIRSKVFKLLSQDDDNVFLEQIESLLSTESLEIMGRAIGFPHQSIVHYLAANYELAITKPLTIQVIRKYHKTSDFYQKIKDIDETDIEQWFKCFIETDDIEFIIYAIEFRLGLEPCCVQLWKLYISYLKDTNNIKVLDVYSRYCRLFIEDLSTVIKYGKEIEKFESSENVEKWWLDIFEFEERFYKWRHLTMDDIIPNEIRQKLRENQFKNISDALEKEKAETFEFLCDKNVADQSTNIQELLPLTPAQKQFFSFPSPFILHILENSLPEFRHKLYEICKYFFNKNHQKPICHMFYVSSYSSGLQYPMFKNQSVHITAKHIDNYQNSFKNYIISSRLVVITEGFSHRNITSKILKFAEINVKFVQLMYQNLSFKELKLLNTKNIWHVILKNVFITNYTNSESFIKIVEMFLHVKRLQLYGYSITSNEVKELTKLKNSSKIQRNIQFHEIQEYFDPEFLLTFLRENCMPKSVMKFYFSPFILGNLRNTFRNALNDFVKEFEIVLQ